MRIKKYRLISERPEENTFLVKRIKKTTMFLEDSFVSDCDGNQLSSRDKESRSLKPSSKEVEGIIAYSLPSRCPAIVEILETDEGIQGDPDSINQLIDPSETLSDKAVDRGRPVNLSSVLGERRIQWADQR